MVSARPVIDGQMALTLTFASPWALAYSAHGLGEAHQQTGIVDEDVYLGCLSSDPVDVAAN